VLGQFLVVAIIAGAIAAGVCRHFYSALIAQHELRVADAQLARDQALDRTKRAEFTLDEIRAQLLHVTPPEPIEQSDEPVSLPDEVLAELKLIEDPGDRADFEQSARAYIAQNPDADADAVVDLVFG